MITFHKGNSRFVLAIPALGVALKIGRIHWDQVLKTLKRAKKSHKRYLRDRKIDYCSEPLGRFFLRELLEYTVDDSRDYRPSIKMSLFGGMVDSWREWRFYKKHRSLRELLHPTYWSFFGLLNIQKYGKPMKARSLMDPKCGELYGCYFKVVGAPLNKDAHHFFYEGNFHYRDGKVLFLDYGGLATQKILSEYCVEILRRFVPPDPSAY